MKKPAIALLPINFEHDFDTVFNDLKKIREVLLDHKEVKNISNLNIIAYFIDSNEVIPNFSSCIVDTYRDVVDKVVNNNFCSKEDIIIEFKESLRNVATDLCNKIDANRISQDSGYCVEFEWLHDEAIQGVYPTEYHPNNLYREISHVIFDSPQVIDQWRTEFNSLILSNLFLVWDSLANIVKDQIMSESIINSFRKGVSIDFAFVDTNVDEWFDHFWIRLNAKVSNSSEVILINYREDIRDADENILHLISQEISISGYEETDNEYNNQNSPYSFTLGPETSEMIFDSKSYFFKTINAHAYLYVLMSKENTEISYQELYELVNNSNGTKNKKVLLIEQVSYFISSIDDSKNSYDLNKLKNSEVVRFQRSINKNYQDNGIQGLKNELKKLEQERENLTKDRSINKDLEEDIEKADWGIGLLKKYISDKKLNTEMEPQLKKISNNVGKQIKKLKEDLSKQISPYFSSSVNCKNGMCKFINSDNIIKWYLKIKKY